MFSPSDRSSPSARTAIWFALLAGLFGVLIGVRNEGGVPTGGSGPALLEPSAHEGATALAFPGESALLSVDPGGQLKRWDLGARTCRTTSLVGRGLYRRDTLRLALDATGKVCVSVVGGGETCYGLDLSGTGSAVRLGSLAWAKPTAGGRYLYGTNEAGRRLYLFRPGSPVPALSLPAAYGWTFSEHSALSPDGRYAAALVKQPVGWQVVAGDTQTGSWEGVSRISATADLQFSPDGGKLGWMENSDGSRTLHSHRTGTWEPEPALALGSGPRLFRYSPDGLRIAVLREAEREYLLAVPLPERRRERVFVIELAASGGARERMPAGRIRGHAAQVRDCVWSPGGRTVATLDEDGRIALWNGQSGRLERFLAPHG